jgi:hypothetical protein
MSENNKERTTMSQDTATATPVREVRKVDVEAIASTGEKFPMERLGVSQERQQLIDKIAQAPKAGIIFVSAYEAKNGHGEVANFVYLKGIDYGNMKERSLAKLNELEADPNFAIDVSYNAWVDENGVESNRKAKGRTLTARNRQYKKGNPVLTEAFAKVRQSIEAPRPATVEYDKHGNGIYEYDGTLQIRDCLLIKKSVIRKGDYPVTASGETVAVADAIKRLLPISKYRQVRLDGRFDYIAIAGELVMQSEGGEKVYVTFSELKGNVSSRIVRSDESIPLEKLPLNIRTAVETLESL